MIVDLDILGTLVVLPLDHGHGSTINIHLSSGTHGTTAFFLPLTRFDSLRTDE